jgi:hypothetical protein
VVVLAAVLLAGCGGSSERTEAKPARLPACAKAPRRAALPHDWSVPLPPGTVVTRVEGSKVRQVVGYAPAPYRATLEYFRDSFPKRGYRIGSGDAEMDEAEADFAGRGTRGRWRVNAIPGCAEVTLVTVAAGPMTG